jgi:quercetin dioxygenase-like cupin family protein
MEIKRSGSQPSAKGPAGWFTGTVRIDSPFKGSDPARVTGAIVTFEPGARTAWHTHPLGQTLIVTGGCGWVQREGGPVEEIHHGDVVWFPPDEKHWHGATPTTAMTHIAIQENLDGKVVDWMEKVSDEKNPGVAGATKTVVGMSCLQRHPADYRAPTAVTGAPHRQQSEKKSDVRYGDSITR